MSIVFLESGTNATYGVQGWSTANANSSAVQAHTGTRSLRVQASLEAGANGVLADAGRRISFYFYRDPSFGLQFRLRDSSDTMIFRLEVDSGGTLRLFVPGFTQIGSDGSVTVPGSSWHRICIAYTITSTSVNAMKVYVDGVLSITTSNQTLASIGTDRLLIDNSGDSGTHYISDVYVDDVAALTDTGDVLVTAKLPTSANANNFDTTGGTGAVNERPLSETNYKQHAAISTVNQNYGIESASAGDVDLTGATILGYQAWIWAKGTAGGAGTPKITNNGTDTAIVLTAAPKLFTNYVTSATYPANAATVGMVSTNNADDTFLYEAGMLIAYIPGGGGGGGGGWLRHRK